MRSQCPNRTTCRDVARWAKKTDVSNPQSGTSIKAWGVAQPNPRTLVEKPRARAGQAASMHMDVSALSRSLLQRGQN
ncbi:MAG: hypothetical protein JWM21_4946 [Acidobacteria bacterium]|nr:hypothetical protein [Acidobacteriota bacterium]